MRNPDKVFSPSTASQRINQLNIRLPRQLGPVPPLIILKRPKLSFHCFYLRILVDQVGLGFAEAVAQKFLERVSLRVGNFRVLETKLEFKKSALKSIDFCSQGFKILLD